MLTIIYLLFCLGFCLVRRYEGQMIPWWVVLFAPIILPVSVGAAIAEILNQRGENNR